MKRIKEKLYRYENLYSPFLVPTQPKKIKEEQHVPLHCCVCNKEYSTYGATLFEECLNLFEGYYYVTCCAGCKEMYRLCELAYAGDA